MTFEEIKALIQLINKSDLAEFRLEDGEQKLVIRTSKYNNGKHQVIHSAPQSPVHVMPSPVPTSIAAVTPAPKAEDDNAPKAAPAPAAPDNAGLLEIKSPIVGTFYRSAGPDKAPYIKVGDTVDKGAVVCIIEAMKLFNEIESDIKGKIVKIVAEDATPVEYDQVLFLVDPKG